MADLSPERGGGERESGERSSIIVHTLAAQSRCRARQDRAGLECSGLGLCNMLSMKTQ